MHYLKLILHIQPVFICGSDFKDPRKQVGKTGNL